MTTNADADGATPIEPLNPDAPDPTGAFARSYLGRLRRLVGSQLVLMPGAQVVVMDADRHVLMQRRADSGRWEFPSGSAEPGQSFVDIAVAELAEEAGVVVPAPQLEAFATASDPAVMHLHYPSGDEVQAFAVCFLVRVETRPAARGVDGEASDHAWWPLVDLPQPLDRTAGAVADRLVAYLDSGRFQAG